MINKLILVALALALGAPVYADEGMNFIPSDPQQSDEVYSSEGGDEPAIIEEDQRRPRRNRNRNPRRNNAPWYFLGCARTSFDCDWEATRRGFWDSRAVYDTWNCRNFYYPYACYVRY